MKVRYERVAKELIVLHPQSRKHDRGHLSRLAEHPARRQLQPIGLLKDYTVIWAKRFEAFCGGKRPVEKEGGAMLRWICIVAALCACAAMTLMSYMDNGSIQDDDSGVVSDPIDARLAATNARWDAQKEFHQIVDEALNEIERVVRHGSELDRPTLDLCHALLQWLQGACDRAHKPDSDLAQEGEEVRRIIAAAKKMALPHLSFRAGGNDDSHGLGFAVS